MKKYLVLATMFFVSACANGPIVGDDDCTYHSAPRKTYRAEEVRPQPAPAPVVVQQPAPVVVQRPTPCNQAVVAPAPVVVQQPTPCNGCNPTVRATREPVEIVYKKVIYTTTYEPKTTSDVTYEREAVKNAQVQEVAVQQPVEVVVQRPVTKEIVVQQPQVSRVIETQVSQEPVKISVEEVK